MAKITLYTNSWLHTKHNDTIVLINQFMLCKRERMTFQNTVVVAVVVVAAAAAVIYHYNYYYYYYYYNGIPFQDVVSFNVSVKEVSFQIKKHYFIWQLTSLLIWSVPHNSRKQNSHQYSILLVSHGIMFYFSVLQLILALILTFKTNNENVLHQLSSKCHI